MSVIINEFEVVVEPPPPAPSATGDNGGAPPPDVSALRPVDLRDTLAHEARRAERVRAH